MDVEIYIKNQIDTVKDYVVNTFKLSISALPTIDEFLETSLNSILSIKIWNEELTKTNHITFKGSLIYLKEIVSNFNQAILLGIIGFRIPSCMMIRRSLENILAFLYYKDHPVEFIKKGESLFSANIKDLKNYITEYPLGLMYIYDIQLNQHDLNTLIRYLINIWSDTYKELSNYVHGSREQYIELNAYIEDITPRDDILRDILPFVEKAGDIINTLLIIFFFKTYIHMKEEKKSLIRLSVKESDIKERISRLFGSI